MSTCVCVLSNSGERLMPTFRLGKVRHLLKDGKAKIVKHHPFTIQLLYDSKTYITSGCHNKGTRLLIPANGKSKSVAISKVQVVCHAGAWIQII